MDLVLRAYDERTMLHLETLPVRRLWTLLESGGVRDAAIEQTHVGLRATPDLYARETIVSRLDALVQEGFGDESLQRLRGGDPPELALLRKAHWPAIGDEEAAALREDLVRYLTYGLWSAPEQIVARTLGMLTGVPGTAFLTGGSAATAEIQAVLGVVEDEREFAARYGGSVRAALKEAGQRHDDAALAGELAHIGQLLGPVSRLLHGARAAGLRVIAYPDQPGGEGLVAFLAREMHDTQPVPDAGNQDGAFTDPVHSNGHGGED